MKKIVTAKIEFICDKERWGAIPDPIPASKACPQWYKDLEKYTVHGEYVPGTFKSCVPARDAMFAGYILPLWTDLHVRINPTINDVLFESPSQFDVVGIHTLSQVKNTPLESKCPFHDNGQDQSFPWKLINPWTIKTPPGYSCLFVQPLNHFEDAPWSFPAAVVDTDSFHGKVNLPFIWEKMPFDGVLPVGMPTVQIIPFKRDDYKSVVRSATPEDELHQQRHLTKLYRTFVDKYQKMFWQKKKYV